MKRGERMDDARGLKSRDEKKEEAEEEGGRGREQDR